MVLFPFLGQRGTDHGGVVLERDPDVRSTFKTVDFGLTGSFETLHVPCFKVSVSLLWSCVRELFVQPAYGFSRRRSDRVVPPPSDCLLSMVVR